MCAIGGQEFPHPGEVERYGCNKANLEEQPAVENLLKASEASAVSSAASPLADIAGRFHLFLFHKHLQLPRHLGAAARIRGAAERGKEGDEDGRERREE